MSPVRTLIVLCACLVFVGGAIILASAFIPHPGRSRSGLGLGVLIFTAGLGGIIVLALLITLGNLSVIN